MNKLSLKYYIYDITNLPTKISDTELNEALIKYGKIDKLTIKKNKDLFDFITAEVVFNPFKDDFLAQDIYIRDYKLNIQLKNKADNQLCRRQVFPINKIQLGNFTDGIFDLEWDINLSKENGVLNNSRFIVNFIDTEFVIFFNYQNDEYKAIISFQDVKEKLIPQEEDGSVSLVINLNRAPKFWIKEKATKQQNGLWERNRYQKRIIAIYTEEDKEHFLDESPFDVSYNYCKKIGYWLSWRFKFHFGFSYDKRVFERVLRDLSKYNLIEQPFNYQKYEVHKSNISADKINSNYMLPFDLNYLVESIISFNLTSRKCITEDFINLLKDKNSKRKTINQGFERLCSEGKFISDLYKYFHKHITSKSLIKGLCFQPSHSVLVRKVAITPTKIYLLPPTLEMTNRIIRQYSSVKDRFLRVVFCDENMKPLGANRETNHNILIRFFCILRYGLKISDRKYRLLAFSSSQLREHGCWFFSDTEDITVETIHQWMGDFSSIHNVAKYAARMGQCFSSSKDGAELEDYNITEIPDIERNGWTFSDGVGKISSELLKKIDGKLDLPNSSSAIQFRMGGYKGVVTLSPELEGEQLCLRPSQKKFESNHLVFEVIRVAHYCCAHLNRQVIILLTALGIKDSVFIELQNEMVEELSKMRQSFSKAISVLANHTDEYGVAKSLIKLIQANLFHSKDNYIKNMLDLVYIYVLTNLKNKARIQVPKGALLIGVMDEYGVLNEDEIFVQCSNSENLNDFKIVTGECIVTRNPCFHPGDVRVVTAVDKKELRHLVNVVVFPSTGYRDIPSQCSGGDLDGDEFTVIWDPRLIPSLKNERPMGHLPAKPKFFEKVETLDICIFFINYILNDNLGAIANSHLALSDARHNGVYDTDCLTLAQRHSRAVDFPKTGIPADLENELRAKEFPDFMQKEDKPMYTSKKILGKLYRSLAFDSFSPTNSFDLNPILRVEGYEAYIASAVRNKAAYDSAIENLMLQYGINNELEVVSGYILNHREMGKKRSYQVRVNLMEAMEDIKKDFRAIFFKKLIAEGQNQVRGKNIIESYKKASAWYFVSYDKGFNKDMQSNLNTFCWVIYDVLCEIAESKRERLATFTNFQFNNKIIQKRKKMNDKPDEENYSVINGLMDNKNLMEGRTAYNTLVDGLTTLKIGDGTN